jgi:uncharacterized protein YbcI
VSDGSLAAEISTAMVKLLTEYTGRGPRQARTYLQDDLVTIVMRDSLTKAERSLIASDAAEHVLTTRGLVQTAMHKDITATVERLTGRRVVAMLSANHIDPDIMIENLLLEPIIKSPES